MHGVVYKKGETILKHNQDHSRLCSYANTYINYVLNTLTPPSSWCVLQGVI